MSFNGKELFDRRKRRVRFQVSRVRGDRHRLTIYRSNMHIYAQVIDDITGHTVASASTVEKSTRKSLKNGANLSAAQAIGKSVATRALKAGISQVVFDRGGYLYHGRIKALAESARAEGLQF